MRLLYVVQRTHKIFGEDRVLIVLFWAIAPSLLIPLITLDAENS
ncbi:MAG: hypothetical protein AAFX78_14530 [Cyanobacteria bacterium J06638_20]